MIGVLFDKWGLTEKEGREILGCTLDEYQEMKQGKIEGFSGEVDEKICGALRIRTALKFWFVDEERRNKWVKKPNKIWGGKCASEMMIVDIKGVRKYLESDVW
ncbi:hypothetical protein [Kiloniella sp.]|uniref:hypothetical protein n=1 Tax=Kiloniella sp. TaxID=1938587 RepID=UPI003A8E191F